MNNFKNFRKVFCKGSLFLFMSMMLVMTSCNTDFPNLLKEDYATNVDGNLVSNGKVLYIVIDGANGETVRQAQLPNILQLANNSMYSFNSLTADEKVPVTNALAWANALTGVNSAKHKVITENFSGNNLAQYPSVISLFESQNANNKTAAFTSSELFAAHFTTAADVRGTFVNDDAAVKNAIVSQLALNNDLVVGHFNQVEATGVANGYSSTQYKNALVTMDNYIGDIMSALQARPNYAKENWLVVITSNKGGANETVAPSATTNLYSVAARNTFTIWYSSRFNSTYITKPSSDDIKYAGFVPLLNSSVAERVNATLNDPTLYTTKATDNWTIQFLHKAVYQNVPNALIISKKRRLFWDYPQGGWAVFSHYGKLCVFNTMCDGGSNWATYYEASRFKTLDDGKWHTVTLVFSGTEKMFKVFLDGQYFDTAAPRRYNSSLATSRADLLPTVTTRLTLGYVLDGTTSNYKSNMKELQIYNVAFTNEEVANNYCLTDVRNNPYFDKLIGWWPIDDLNKNVLKEKTGKYGDGANFTIQGTSWKWSDFNDAPNVLCPPPGPTYYKLVPNLVDNPYMIMQWLGLRIQPEWGFDGRGWSPSYKTVVP